MKKQIISMAMAAMMSLSAMSALTVSASADWIKNGSICSYTDNSGKKLTGWQDIDGSRYFFSKFGTMRTGWRMIDGKTYYFRKDGKMCTGSRRINGKVYTFDKNGVLIASEKTADLSAADILGKLKKSMGGSYTCDHICEEKGFDGLEFYGFDMNKVENWAYENSSISSINMDTALILRVKDGYADEAARLIQERFDDFGCYALTYGYDEYRVKEARLFVKGNYVGFFILGDRGAADASADEQAKLAKTSGEKLDKAWEEIFGVKPENIVKIPKAIELGENLDGMVG